MPKSVVTYALLSAFFVFQAPAQAAVYTESIADHGAQFDAAVAAAGGTAQHDHWNNFEWDANTGQYGGSAATPFITYGADRGAYSVEKGLLPLGISYRSIFFPEYDPTDPNPGLVHYSELNGSGINLGPDTQPIGGSNIPAGFHSGIEYGLVFTFDQPIYAFGLEFNVEAHNEAGLLTFASLYYALDGGVAQVAGPFDLTAASNGNSTEFSSFVGIIEQAHPFSTITFFTDGPRGSDGALQAFYNAYAGGTIHFASVSTVPEIPAGWLLLGGLGILARLQRRSCKHPKPILA